MPIGWILAGLPRLRSAEGTLFRIGRHHLADEYLFVATGLAIGLPHNHTLTTLQLLDGVDVLGQKPLDLLADSFRWRGLLVEEHPDRCIPHHREHRTISGGIRRTGIGMKVLIEGPEMRTEGSPRLDRLG